MQQEELDADALIRYDFQYPQADRRGCNGQITAQKRLHGAAFSIHKRIEGGATDDISKLMSPFYKLSVSTSGSKGVQLSVYTDISNVEDVLSVSTSGSKGVQRPHTTEVDTESESFSIHKRIEGGATMCRIMPRQ